MISNQGRRSMARLYEVEGGTHFEHLYSQHPGLLRTVLPCFRDAFHLLEQWTENGKPLPRSHLIKRDSSVDLLNTCDLMAQP
jgi:hypothetical protein